VRSRAGSGLPGSDGVCSSSGAVSGMATHWVNGPNRSST
jgi:hypothetical protein